MTHVVKAAMAAALVSIMCMGFGWAENRVITGYVHTTGIPQALGDAEMMDDPSVRAPVQTGKATVRRGGMAAHQRVHQGAATRTKPRLRIAVVPHDYKDQYNVSAFDSRRGDVHCNMKGIYAHCTYNK